MLINLASIRTGVPAAPDATFQIDNSLMLAC